MCALKIADNTNGGIPVMWSVAIKYRSQSTNGKGYVRACCDSEVVEAANKGTVGCVSHPFTYSRHKRFIGIGVCNANTEG
jgi:hypothetical protein